jgi:hypothetical protein
MARPVGAPPRLTEQEAAVLVAVGVTQHHLDRAVTRAQGAFRKGDLQEDVEDLGRVAEVVDGLEQGDDLEVKLLRPEACVAGKEVDAEDVVGGAGHREDEGADGLGVVRDPGLTHEGEEVEKFACLGRQPGTVGMAQVGAAKFHAQAAGPVRGAIGRCGAGERPKFGQDRSGDGGVLPDVERMGAKAEDLGLPAQGRQVAGGQPVGAKAKEAIFQHAQIGEKMADRGVAPCPAAQQDLQPVGDGGEGLSEDFARIAGRKVGRAGAPGDDRLDPGLNLGRNRSDPRGDADPRGGSGHGVEITAENRPAGAVERVSGGGGGDIRVAVTVAADPGVEADARGDGKTLAKAVGGGGGETVEQLWHGIVKRVAEELQAPFDFVGKAGAFDAQLSGHPEKVDLAFDIGEDVVAFARGPALGFKRDQQAVDAAVDFQDGDALGLGRVGGERGANGEPGGKRGKIVAAHGGVEAGERGGEAALDGLRALRGLGHAAGPHGGVLVDDPGQLEPDVHGLQQGNGFGSRQGSRGGQRSVQHLGRATPDDVAPEAAQVGPQRGGIVVALVHALVGEVLGGGHLRPPGRAGRGHRRRRSGCREPGSPSPRASHAWPSRDAAEGRGCRRSGGRRGRKVRVRRRQALPRRWC